ncbi:hypothetical protein AVEN_200505-1 [Araneus ventricosus]|uniref:Uncharacterized protein n=1 Tax=Araneus ventricosus TaxID=182803 RepID=A0A4Y2K450_ARAVE|nr:hypothetical protein AVEN_200505-1 [Araneus ventricosus]
MNTTPQLVEINSDSFFLPSTCLPLYRANRRVLFPYAFTEHPESILYRIWYIKSILPNFPDNPNSPESEPRSAPIGSDSWGSTVLRTASGVMRGIMHCFFKIATSILIFVFAWCPYCGPLNLTVEKRVKLGVPSADIAAKG